MITPTGDMMTQTIFAAPMVGLYFVSIVIAWVVGPKRPPRRHQRLSELRQVELPAGKSLIDFE